MLSNFSFLSLFSFFLGLWLRRLEVVPWDYDFSGETCDGIFISNGPGDPVMAGKTIEHLAKAMAAHPQRPIFGICLGHQLLGKAVGASTYAQERKEKIKKDGRGV